VFRYGLLSRAMYGCPETPLTGSDRCRSHPRENSAAEETADGDFPDLVCDRCNKQTDGDKMVVCGDVYGHGCDRGFHIDCLRPALKKLPAGAWFCSDCTEVLSKGRSGKAGTGRDPLADDTRLADNAVRLGRTRSKTVLAQDIAKQFRVDRLLRVTADVAVSSAYLGS